MTCDHPFLGGDGRNEEGSARLVLGDGDRNEEADIAHSLTEEERGIHLQAGMAGKTREGAVGLVSAAFGKGVADLLALRFPNPLFWLKVAMLVAGDSLSLLVEGHPRIFQSLARFPAVVELEERRWDEEGRVCLVWSAGKAPLVLLGAESPVR